MVTRQVRAPRSSYKIEAPARGGQDLQDQEDACRLTGLGRTYGKGVSAHRALDSIDL